MARLERSQKNNERMKDVIIYDIETMQELFLVVCMVPGKAGKSFQVSKWKNELDKFVKLVSS